MSPKEFTSEDFLVSFGPSGTVVANCPNNIFFHNIDVYVSEDLQDILSRASGVNAVAYPAVGRPAVPASSKTKDPQPQSELVLADEVSDPYVAYSRKSRMITHHDMYQPSGKAAMPKLNAWLDDRLSQSAIQVVSDAQGGWWASSGNEVAFNSVPPALRQLLKPSNPDGQVIHVALGIGGSFVAVFENGNFQWDLKNLYPDLDSYLTGRTTGDLVYVSLDPFRAGRYFAAFKDASILYKFPDSAAKLESSLIEADDLRVILFSDTVRHSAVALPQNRSFAAEFAEATGRKLVDKMEEQAADNLIEVAQGIVEEVIDASNAQ